MSYASMSPSAKQASIVAVSIVAKSLCDSLRMSDRGAIGRLLITCLAITSLALPNVEAAPPNARTPEAFTQPLQTLDLAVSEPGVVDAIAVREGDSVRAGDLICQLRCDVLKASRHATLTRINATGKRDAAAATLAHRQNHLAQLESLLAKNHANDQEVAEAKFNVQLAQAQLQTVDDARATHQAELKQIDAQIARRRVVAPIGGIVLQLPARIGERVGTSESPVAQLVVLNQLRVRFHLTTNEASLLAAGKTRSLYFPESHSSAVGIVDFVAPTTDGSSGTVRVELLIDNARGTLRSGVRCQLMLNDPTQTTRLNRRFPY